MIQERRREGVFIKDIAQELGVHPKTVSRAVDRGSEPPPRPKGKRPTKLEPFKAQVDAYLADGIWNAAVILRKLKAAGYTGGYTVLREYIKPKRVLRPEPLLLKEIASKELVVLLDEWNLGWPGLYLYFPKNRDMPAALRAVIDALREP